MLETIQNIDFAVIDFIQEHIRCAFLDTVLPIITNFAEAGIGWIALAVLLLFFKKTRKTALMMGVALILGLLIGNATLKPLVARVRPYDINTAVELLVAPLHDFSFPSGHTLASFECAGVLMIRDKRLGIPALVLAIIIAFSRLYLYVHYPTDIIVGALLGLLFAFIGVFVINKIFDTVEARTGKKVSWI